MLKEIFHDSFEKNLKDLKGLTGSFNGCEKDKKTF